MKPHHHTQKNEPENLDVNNPIYKKTYLPGRTRTCNIRIRNPLLYPIELQGEEKEASSSAKHVSKSHRESETVCIPALNKGGKHNV